MKNLFLISLVVFLAGCLRGKPDHLAEHLEQAKTEELEGALHMLLDDFGAIRQHGLTSNILPFKIYSTALLMRAGFDPESGDVTKKMQEIFKSYGIMVDAKVANMPDNYEVNDVDYLTLFKGTMRGGKRPARLSLEATGFSCSSCHGGHSYDKLGNPLPEEIYLGTPNTSINIEKFTADVFDAFLKIKDNRYKFLGYLLKVFPHTTKSEYRAIKFSFNSAVRKKMNQLQRNLGRVFPVVNGGAGLTNGVGSLKFQLGLIGNNKLEQDETGYTSIPVIYDRGFRNSLLYDGVYAPKDNDSKSTSPDEHKMNLAKMVAFFTVSTSANLISVAERKFEQAKKVLTFLETAERPEFPGEVDFTMAKKGQKIYQNKCASCHGAYSDELYKNGPKLISYPNKLVGLDEIGTDESRSRVIDELFINTVNNTAMSNHMKAQKNHGYIATILTSAWTTAPYLHNGSVPSLWALMNPKERPERFLVGGHKMNFAKVGIKHESVSKDGVHIYENGYKPWAQAEVYDTRLKGRGNQGHEAPFDTMTQEEKKDLIEYMKLL